MTCSYSKHVFGVHNRQIQNRAQLKAVEYTFIDRRGVILSYSKGGTTFRKGAQWWQMLHSKQSAAAHSKP
eukprot:1009-Heterococcus_DN1.PRE.3